MSTTATPDCFGDRSLTFESGVGGLTTRGRVAGRPVRLHARRPGQVLEEIDDGLRLSFPPDAELARQLVVLATAEQGCCAFFDLTPYLAPDADQLSVMAIESTAGMVADLFGVPAF